MQNWRKVVSEIEKLRSFYSSTSIDIKEQRARVDEPFARLYSDWATLHEIDKR